MYNQESFQQCIEFIKENQQQTWTLKRYLLLWEKAQQVAEPEYGDFNARLLPNIERNHILGIRLPVLRKLANAIAKSDAKSYLQVVSDYGRKKALSQEEKHVSGFVIAKQKDFKFVIDQTKKYLPTIDNWSICDSFCTSLKITNEHRNEMYSFLKECIASEMEYTQRFGYVMLLNYFIDEEHIDEIFALCNRDDLNRYYIQMAVAWLLSMCYVKLPERTLSFLKSSVLDDFTYNKSLQKMIESYQLTKEAKVYLKTLKRP